MDGGDIFNPKANNYSLEFSLILMKIFSIQENSRVFQYLLHYLYHDNSRYFHTTSY